MFTRLHLTSGNCKHHKMIKTFLLLLFFSSIKPSASKNTIHDYLQRGSSLSVDDSSHVIRSPDNSYTCGFYGFQTNAYWFAIWFTKSKERTVVWTANCDTPVSGRGSKLTFRRNGAVSLTNVDGMSTWETNTTSIDVKRLVLLNTGNLVLKNKRGEILWQSFDYPTDTLLPTQPLTKSKTLVSALRKGNYKPLFCRLNHSFADSTTNKEQNYGFDLDYKPQVSFEECRELCLGDCRCQAFSYRLTGEGVCFPKGTLYLKVPIGLETTLSPSIIIVSNATCVEVTVMVGSPSMYESSGTKVKWVYLYSFTLAIGVAEASIFVLGWWLFYKKKCSLKQPRIWLPYGIKSLLGFNLRRTDEGDSKL
ncbi:hypothetical protein LXL04_036277 [Taraxacum kok-saghyz]